MSGIEAAGLALAFLPLLIAAVKHYDDCLRPFLDYKHFAKEADRYRQQLSVQKTIFRGHCLILLKQVVEHDAASSMLRAADNPAWSDGVLESQISQMLGESKEACITTVVMIEENLREIESENQGLWTAIDEDHQKNKTSVKDRAWRRRIIEKLSFSSSKKRRLDRNIAELRSLNNCLKTLSEQYTKSTLAQSKTPQSNCDHPAQAIEKYRLIGQASRQVYEALGRACTKHTEHQAHFCVEVEQAVVYGRNGAQVKFNMAYTHLTLAGSADQGDLVWFAVDSKSGEAMSGGHAGTAGTREDKLSQLLKRQITPDPALAPRKVQKKVRFQTSYTEQVEMPYPTATTSLHVPQSINSMRKDFCDHLRRCFQEHRASAYVTVLEKTTDGCMNVEYPPSSACCYQRRQAVSLGQLISSITKPNFLKDIPLFERYRLAKTLAITVLQFHATPWLNISWRSEDVYFFGLDQESPARRNSLTLSSPHLNVKVKGPAGRILRASTFPPHTLARNPLLFSLGVMLLEIAYSTNLDELQRPSDLENGQVDRYTEFFVARRLAKSGCTGMGLKYDRIVERLIECDFGQGNDLSNTQLQAAIHKTVICPLEKLEQDLRSLHLDS